MRNHVLVYEEGRLWLWWSSNRKDSLQKNAATPAFKDDQPQKAWLKALFHTNKVEQASSSEWTASNMTLECQGKELDLYSSSHLRWVRNKPRIRTIDFSHTGYFCKCSDQRMCPRSAVKSLFSTLIILLFDKVLLNCSSIKHDRSPWFPLKGIGLLILSGTSH